MKHVNFLGAMGLLIFSLASRAQAQWDPAPGTWVNTPIVITNNTQYSDQDIWVAFNFGIAETTTPQTYGENTFGDTGALQYGPFATVDWQYAKLADFKVDSSTIPYYSGQSVYSMNLNNFTGRIYVSYGAALTGVPVASEQTPYVVFEPYIVGQVNSVVTPASPAPAYIPASASNIDLSYVDGVSAPASTYIRNATTGAYLAATTNNPITTHPDIMSHMETGLLAAGVGSAAFIKDISGDTTRILSASNTPEGTYHDWSTLMNNTGPLLIASYTSPNEPSSLQQYGLTNTLFGYSGAAAISGQATNFQNAQGYTATAVFGPAGVTITGQGIQNPGGPAATGAFTITITTAALEAPTGIYGQNPAYTVTTGAGSYTTAGVVNDLGGRIVGDLLAGMVFGWANSGTDISALAASTGLTVVGTLSSNTIGQLSTGEFFYLMSLAAANGLVTDWTGAGIAAGADYYDIYNYLISQESGAYGSGFGDRYQGIYSPSTTWYTSYPPANPLSTDVPPADFETVGFVELELVPEPSTNLLMLLGAGMVLFMARRKFKRS